MTVYPLSTALFLLMMTTCEKIWLRANDCDHNPLLKTSPIIFLSMLAVAAQSILSSFYQISEAAGRLSWEISVQCCALCDRSKKLHVDIDGDNDLWSPKQSCTCCQYRIATCERATLTVGMNHYSAIFFNSSVILFLVILRRRDHAIHPWCGFWCFELEGNSWDCKIKDWTFGVAEAAI